MLIAQFLYPLGIQALEDVVGVLQLACLWNVGPQKPECAVFELQRIAMAPISMVLFRNVPLGSVPAALFP